MKLRHSMVFAIKALQLWLLVQVVAGSKTRTDETSCKNCFIMHKFADDYKPEGIGSLTMRIHPLLHFAERFGLTYVCQKEDFETGMHASGNLGRLFGCLDNSTAMGDKIASFDHLPKGLTLKNAHILDVRHIPNIHLDIPLVDNSLYVVRDDRPLMEKFGESYKWFRSQYAQMRDMDEKRRNPSCWAGSNGKKKIALHVRRGDGRFRGYPVDFYMKILDMLFTCKTKMKDLCIQEKDAKIVVMAEADPSDTTMSRFNDYRQADVSLLLGEPETDLQKSQDRLVADLDCMSVADVLVTSGGGFSALAAAVLHDEGKSLTWNADAHREDMPNAVHKAESTFVAMHNPNSKLRHSGNSLEPHLIESADISNALQIAFYA